MPILGLWKQKLYLLSSFITALLSLGCSTTQKTAGTGGYSAVAQNVVRIALVEASKNLDFSPYAGQSISCQIIGFADENMRPYFQYFFESKLEDAGCSLGGAESDLKLQVVVHSAGNDVGYSSIIIQGRSRSEGKVNMSIILRDKNNQKLMDEDISGESKFESRVTLGVAARDGAYYVNKDGEKWIKIGDPNDF